MSRKCTIVTTVEWCNAGTFGTAEDAARLPRGSAARVEAARPVRPAFGIVFRRAVGGLGTFGAPREEVLEDARARVVEAERVGRGF